MNVFKPQLLPNNKAGVKVDWELAMPKVSDYLFSYKYDGARVEIFFKGVVKGRSLKPLASKHIKQMAKDFYETVPFHEDGVVEAEFYSPNMNFSEIMHFFKTEDVTSIKTETKYAKLWLKTKEGTVEFLNGKEYPAGTYSNSVDGNLTKWGFPGRTVKWLTTWHSCLKFYAFDYVQINNPEISKINRYMKLTAYLNHYKKNVNKINYDMVLVIQSSLKHIDEVYQMYDQAALEKMEGLVAIHKQSSYKFGRHSLNSANAFKMKDDNLDFDGVIVDVEEATEAREGAEKTKNELGRSVTSKLKEDRIPSGMAKGFKVMMDDDNCLIVSLKGYDHSARRELLQNKEEYIGQWIKFTGMAPTKEGGCPRHAHATAGFCFRDDK